MKRVELTALYPDYQGENINDWSNHLLSKSSEYGTYRQCSLGWHDECSQRDDGDDADCACLCHDSAYDWYSVEGHSEEGTVVPTRSDKGKQYWPAQEGEPATMWAHWVLAKDYSDAERRAVAKQNAIRTRKDLSSQ